MNVDHHLGDHLSVVAAGVAAGTSLQEDSRIGSRNFGGCIGVKLEVHLSALLPDPPLMKRIREGCWAWFRRSKD